MRKFLRLMVLLAVVLGLAVSAGAEITGDVLSTDLIWNGHRYRVIARTTVFADAEAECEAAGGHLATILSEEENQAVIDHMLLLHGYSEAMIGLQDSAGASGKWDTWITGEPVAYSNWGPGQPDFAGQTVCILCADSSSTYGWSIGEWDSGYDGDYWFICEWDYDIADAAAKIFDFPIEDTSVGISTGFYGYHDHNGYDLGAGYGTAIYALFDGTATYKIRYNMHSDGKYHSWSYGNYCELQADELISGDKYMMLIAHLSSFDVKNYNVPTHIDGIELICDHGAYRGERGWFYGLSEDIIGTMHVKKGQLLGYSGSCGNSTGNHLHIGISKNGTYVDPDEYISNARSVYVGSNEPEKGKPDFTWNGHEYRIYNDRMTWTEAQEYCEMQGGHLVTITTQEEQNFIDSINSAKLNCWIGGYRESGGSTQWFWVTGEVWSYTNWDNGEPNNSSNVISNETCVAIWPSKWNDLNNKSTEQNGFICEWDSAEKTESITITTKSLPDGTAGISYSATLSSNPSGAAWSISSGSLPNGLTLSESGIISGTPTSTGTFDFTIQARNAYTSTTKSFRVSIYANTNNSDAGESSGGGGCNSGSCIVSLMLLAGAAFRKFHR